MKKSGVFLVKDNLPQVLAAIKSITQREVLVGVPAAKAGREGGGINNATLAFIHDQGAPEANIPARPFMRPGIHDARAKIAARLASGARGVLRGDDAAMTRSLEAAGADAVEAIRKRINEGPPPPLQLSTIRARARGRNGRNGSEDAQRYLAFMDWPRDAQKAAREAGEMGTAKPLVVTGELRNSITYVVAKIESK